MLLDKVPNTNAVSTFIPLLIKYLTVKSRVLTISPLVNIINIGIDIEADITAITIPKNSAILIPKPYLLTVKPTIKPITALTTAKCIFT